MICRLYVIALACSLSAAVPVIAVQSAKAAHAGTKVDADQTKADKPAPNILAIRTATDAESKLKDGSAQPNSWQSWLQSFFAAIGGGLFVSLVNHKLSKKATKEEREAGFLRQQLQLLYGPLHYYLSLNTVNEEYCDQLIQAGNETYAPIPRSERSEEELRTWTKQIRDCYDLVTKNAFIMLEITEHNYSYLDPDDMVTFRLFASRCTRWKNEYTEDGELRIDKRIKERMGSYRLCTNGFIQQINGKFAAKQKRLKELGG